jgi:hypothetical protein
VPPSWTSNVASQCYRRRLLPRERLRLDEPLELDLTDDPRELDRLDDPIELDLLDDPRELDDRYELVDREEVRGRDGLLEEDQLDFEEELLGRDGLYEGLEGLEGAPEPGDIGRHTGVPALVRL